MNESNNIFLMESVLLGAIANCAVRQSPYHRPDNLELVLDKYHEIVAPVFEKSPLKVAELTPKELEELIAKLGDIPEYRAWNERKNGNKSPLQFTSRYDVGGNPDDDFIDLDALEMNVFRLCVEED